MNVALQHRMPTTSSLPSQRWLSRIRGRQLVIAADHEDYPALVAEALDTLQGTGFEVAPAASTLRITGTQLVKLFKKTPAAWVALNAYRASVGLPELK